ncbi:MAG: hypothetical protein GX278_01900 [Aeromonadales bacterium]|nr:hypothetical protein [Aeromonadales bacterium]
MLVDAHIHVGMFKDIKSVLLCAQDNNIVPVCVSTSLEEGKDLLSSLKESSLKVPVFLGIHPWYMQKHGFDEELLDSLIKDTNVKGIGECGLDNKIDIPLHEQIDLLSLQLDYAAMHNLPVNLHIRGYHGDLHRVLKQYQGRLRGIIHNTTFSYDVCRKYLDSGFLLSVGHHLTYMQKKLTDVLLKVGLDNLLLETDFDYEYTGEFDPTLLKSEYECLSMLFQHKIESIETVLYNNLKDLLGNIK